MKEILILVDRKDRQTGKMEKMEVHKKALLHRAFSLFIFNSRGEMLLQRRARSKYHAGGLWTNTCCGHPRDGEELEKAAHRRLMEEMGFDTDLSMAFPFIYKAALDNDLTEHEYDYAFTGLFEGKVKPNSEEADGYKWIRPEEVMEDVKKNPDNYTPWFRIALPKVMKAVSEK